MFRYFAFVFCYLYLFWLSFHLKASFTLFMTRSYCMNDKRIGGSFPILPLVSCFALHLDKDVWKELSVNFPVLIDRC